MSAVVVIPAGPVSAAASGSPLPALETAASAPAPAAGRPTETDCPAEVRAWAGQSDAALGSMADAAQARALARASAVLGASANDFERAIGQMLLHPPAQWAEGFSAQAIRPVIEGALGSRDPRLVALAHQLCSHGEGASEGDCTRDLARHWAALEPDNLHAWLAVAQDATARNDLTAAQAALARAAASSDSRLLWGQAQGLIARPALRGNSPMEDVTLVVELANIESIADLSSLGSLMTLCSVDAVQDGERMAACRAIAGTMIERSRTLIEQGMAIAVARRTGWAPERIEQVSAEHDRLRRAFVDALPRLPNQDGPITVAQACEAHRSLRWMLAHAASGNEIESARRLIGSGEAASRALPR